MIHATKSAPSASARRIIRLVVWMGLTAGVAVAHVDRGLPRGQGAYLTICQGLVRCARHRHTIGTFAMQLQETRCNWLNAKKPINVGVYES